MFITLSGNCATALLATAAAGRFVIDAVSDAVLIGLSSQSSIAARLVAACTSLAITALFC